VRSVLWIVFLNSIAVTGCVASRFSSHVATATAPPTVFRAESSGLSELESAAHQKRKEHDSKKKPERHSTAPHCDTRNTVNNSLSDSSEQTSLVGQVALTALASPFAIPCLLIGDDHDHFTEFPDYPYADDVPGSLLVNSEFKGTKQTWGGTLQSFAIPGSHDLDRFGGRLLLENADRIGIDTETDYLLQTHRHGGPDHAWMGDFNVVYRFAESENMQWRAGVGLNWLADQTKPEFGINFTYGFDWYPRRPWTISSVIDAGTIGESSMFHNRSTIGVMLGPAELFAGYDYLQLGTAHVQGPVAGVGYRF